MNVNEVMELFGPGNKKFWTLQSGDHFNAGETLACEVERLRAEVQRLDIAGTHTCHESCPKLPCVQRREIERLRDELAETKAEFNGLSESHDRLEAELAAAKAASVVPVEVLDCYYNAMMDLGEVRLICKSGSDAQKVTDWLREWMKEGVRGE